MERPCKEVKAEENPLKGIEAMGEEKTEERRTFKVIDKRFFAQKNAIGGLGSEKKEQQNEGPRETSRKQVLPITFSGFVYSLSTTCLMHLGEIPDPSSQKVKKNLLLAKQTIDLLEILAEKTKGNLTPEEDSLLKSVLTELRFLYVKALSGE